jgi:hypothetical protein
LFIGGAAGHLLRKNILQPVPVVADDHDCFAAKLI